jgi:hypothetical protein
MSDQGLVTADAELIRELYGRYIHALRRDDYGALADCFCEDAELRLSGGDGPSGGDGVSGTVARGREGISDLLQRMGPGRPRHHTSDLWIASIECGEAHCQAQFLLLDRVAGTTIAYGQYDDRAVRGPDGTWRWRQRDIHFDWRSPSYTART